MHRRRLWLGTALLLLPLSSFASFIESTIGTAVVNDATAVDFNPAALTLLKNPQIIGLGSVAYFHTQFTGQSTQTATGLTQTGTTNTNTNYYLPSFYFALPVTKNITTGIAVISNIFDRELDENTLLRYVQATNSIKDVDIVPAIGVKVNDVLSVGASITYSYANFLLQPISGFPSLNIPDVQSRNDASSKSFGGDVGLLLQPAKATLIGFNYHTAISYHLSGTSTLETMTPLVSNNYSFNFWTPARSVLTVSQFVSPKLGFIGTAQRVQWSIFNTVTLHNVATQVGPTAQIVPSATIPFHWHNTWIVTGGTQYKITPKWIVRAAATYNESPGNSSYQITNGNSVILGASAGYEINKYFIIDGSYAHAFIQNKSINVTTGTFLINGINRSIRDSYSLKLTVNV